MYTLYFLKIQRDSILNTYTYVTVPRVHFTKSSAYIVVYYNNIYDDVLIFIEHDLILLRPKNNILLNIGIKGVLYFYFQIIIMMTRSYNIRYT